MTWGGWGLRKTCCPEPLVLLDHTSAATALDLTAAIGRETLGIWDTMSAGVAIPGSIPITGQRYLMGWAATVVFAGGNDQTVVLEFLELGAGGTTDLIAGEPAEPIVLSGFETQIVPFCFPIRGRGIQLVAANNVALAASIGILLLATSDPAVAAQFQQSDRWRERVVFDGGVVTPGIDGEIITPVVYVSPLDGVKPGAAPTTDEGLMQVHTSALAYQLHVSDNSIGAFLLFESARVAAMTAAVPFHRRAVGVLGDYSSSEEDASALSAVAAVRAGGAGLRSPGPYWRGRFINGATAQGAAQFSVMAGGPVG